MTDSTPSAEGTQFAVLAHLLGIFTSFLGPLIVWLAKRDSDEFIADQAKEALNFQITAAIGHLAASFMTTVVFFIGWIVGGLLSIAVWIVVIWWGIQAIVAANSGTKYRYPFALRLVR